jgi:putative phosphoesterase
MQLAVLADIHGNLPALEAVLADIQQQRIDGIIVAGDFIGGAQPLETIQLLRSYKSWIIRGNGENYYLTYDTGNAPDAWRVSKQWASMRWLYLRLNRKTLDFVASLPEQRVLTLNGTAPIRIVHGSLQNPSELLLPEHDQDSLQAYRSAGFLSSGYKTVRLNDTLNRFKEPVLVCGHSHILWKYKQDGRLVMNAGSVGQPLNGDTRSQYALLNWQDGRWQATFKAIEYDLDQVRAAYIESGLLAEGGALARALLLCSETGQNVAGCFLSYAYRLAAEAGYNDCDVVPDRIWEQATATFDWETAAQ